MSQESLRGTPPLRLVAMPILLTVYIQIRILALKSRVTARESLGATASRHLQFPIPSIGGSYFLQRHLNQLFFFYR